MPVLGRTAWNPEPTSQAMGLTLVLEEQIEIPIDARGKDLLFRIHRRGPTQYDATPSDADRYQHSPVLGCWYRLDRSRNPRGRVVFDLHQK